MDNPEAWWLALGVLVLVIWIGQRKAAGCGCHAAAPAPCGSGAVENAAVMPAPTLYTV